jgi:hypothetical protein
MYLADHNGDFYKRALADILAFRYGIREELKEVDGLRNGARMVRNSVNFARWRLGTTDLWSKTHLLYYQRSGCRELSACKWWF